MRIIYTLLFLAFSLSIYAQRLTGKIADHESPVANATVSLLRARDSFLLRTALSDQEGRFMLATPGDSSFLLCITAAGFQSRYIIPQKDYTTISMERKIQGLQEVQVKAKKPLVDVLPDKLVFNVENSINAMGSNGLELLQKSPGVIVDKDDKIVLSGKTGVKIYIDGSTSPLAGTDLASYLRSLNSIDIEAIEIITNPSARYEAEGNAGIINIRLKKNRNFGWNGTLAGGYGIGIFSKYNGGASLNYRNKKINLYSNISSFSSKNFSELDMYRIQNDTTYDQYSDGVTWSSGTNLKTGLDIFLNRSATLGVMVTASTGSNRWEGDSRTPIAAAASKDHIEQVLVANGNSHNKRNNLTTNINYAYTGAKGRQLNIDADYGAFRLRNQSITPNVYTSAGGGQVFSRYTFSTNTPSNIDLFSVKGDYEQNAGKGKLALGFKSSSVKTDNDFSFFNHDNYNNPVFDTTRSNRFTYTEWIQALYAQYKGQSKKWSYQAGVRLEQTNSEGNLLSAVHTGDEHVKRSYLNLFPGGGVTWQANKKNTLGVSVSRRIDRPQYQDLNPFENKIDELSYRKGNPFLRPQYTNIIELRHVYNYTLTTTLSYSNVKDFFAQISDTIEGKRSFIMQRNLANQKIVSLNISYPFSITTWWSVYANLNLYHTRYRASFEHNKTIRLDATVASIYQQQSFQLGKKWTGELSGFFNSPSIWAGTYKTGSIGTLDAGLQKKFLNDNATLKATLTDIFLTMPWKGSSRFGGLYSVASGRWESRQLKINFTWRFGNKQVKNARNRNTGLEDLNQRVN